MCEMEGDMAVYGYARVSTDGQSLSAQLAELKAAQCAKIFQEKISGARFERELIRTRTGEGRERAKARGVVLGRKPKLSPHQRREALARREAGEVLTDIARTYNVSHSTISRL